MESYPSDSQCLGPCSQGFNVILVLGQHKTDRCAGFGEI